MLALLSLKRTTYIFNNSNLKKKMICKNQKYLLNSDAFFSMMVESVSKNVNINLFKQMNEFATSQDTFLSGLKQISVSISIQTFYPFIGYLIYTKYKHFKTLK